MAIRSTNMNRAAKAGSYDPTARASARGPGEPPPRNTDGPGNSHLDYGPPKPYTQRDRYADAREEYGNSPWYRRGNAEPMPWAGPPGQKVGPRAPFYTPDAGDPRNAGYWAAGPTSEELQARNRQLEAKQAADWERRSQHEGYAGAIEQLQAAGYDPFNRDNPANIKFEMQMGKNPEMRRLFEEAKLQRTLADNPGLPRDYRSREWPVPSSVSGGSTHYPNGSSAPRPAGVGPTGAPPATAQQAFPPSQNPMMQGYLGGGAPAPTHEFRGAPAPTHEFRGAPPASTQALPPSQNPMFQGYQGQGIVQGPGGFGQFNPMQSKSGMGQNPMSGPAMSTGYPGGGAGVPQGPGGFGSAGGGNPFLEGNHEYRADRASQMGGGGYNPMMGGGGMGGMGFGGFGGFNPMLGGGMGMGYNRGMGMGYNPGAQFSPYRNMMMGGY